MIRLIESWLKHAALEAQEYVRLTVATFVGMFTRPFYRHDIVEQLDVIGFGSLTVVLLAGLFKTEPRQLVAGTSYPLAKAERLPIVSARYTEVELLIALLDNDLAWIERTGDAHRRRVLDEWEARLAAVDDDSVDLRERELVRDARKRVRVSRDRG